MELLQRWGRVTWALDFVFAPRLTTVGARHERGPTKVAKIRSADSQGEKERSPHRQMTNLSSRTCGGRRKSVARGSDMFSRRVVRGEPGSAESGEERDRPNTPRYSGSLKAGSYWQQVGSRKSYSIATSFPEASRARRLSPPDGIANLRPSVACLATHSSNVPLKCNQPAWGRVMGRTMDQWRFRFSDGRHSLILRGRSPWTHTFSELVSPIYAAESVGPNAQHPHCSRIVTIANLPPASFVQNFRQGFVGGDEF